MSLFFWMAKAFPCAGLVHGADVHVESGTQQVIYSHNGATTSATYQIQYDGDAVDFGWVIPMYGSLEMIEEGDAARFTFYDALTAPQTIYEYAPSQGCGSAQKGSANDAFTADESRFVTGFAGQFSYVVVPVAEASSFSEWGQENGWDTTGITSMLSQYSTEEEVSLVLLRIRQDLEPESINSSPAIHIEYSGQEMRYPALLSQLSPEEELHTVVYIEGTHRADVEGWDVQRVGELQGSTEDSATDIFEERLRELSATRATMGLVYSGEIEGMWVTRYDTMVTPPQNIVEPIFIYSNEQNEVETIITLSESSSSWMVGVLFLLSMLGRKRKQTL